MPSIISGTGDLEMNSRGVPGLIELTVLGEGRERAFVCFFDKHQESILGLFLFKVKQF